MRLVSALFKHETNTFSPLQTSWESFGDNGPWSGDSAIAVMRGTGQPIGAFIDFADRKGAELILPIAGRATPSGLVSRDAFERAVDALLAGVKDGCDAVLLDLHGAMVVDGIDDADGEIVRRVRHEVGNTPIGVALDFHANVSSCMAENATVIVGYKTYPHIDMYETGAKVTHLIDQVLSGSIRPVIHRLAVPMLPHTLCQNTSKEPMKALVDAATAAEAKDSVLSTSVFAGFYSSDVPHAGLTVITVCDDLETGPEVAATIARQAWASRSRFIYRPEALADSIARAKIVGKGPIVLVDHCDNASAGATQDTMAVVQEVIRQNLTDVVVGSIRDPEAVACIVQAGVGATLTIPVGGKSDMPELGLKGEPLLLTGKVIAISDGQYTIDGPVFTGMHVNMGITARFDVNGVELVITERNTEPFDLNVFRCVGIDPTQRRYILLKSKMHFRGAYEPIATEIIECNGIGVATSDLSLLRYRKVRRPIYPLDDFNSAFG